MQSTTCKGPAPLIENIFANKCDPNFIAGNLVTTISDHLKQFLICSSKIEKLKLWRTFPHTPMIIIIYFKILEKVG